MMTLALTAALPVAAHAQALPDGKALVARHVAAMGGREAMDKHSSLNMLGTFSMAAMGIEGPVHVWRAKPNKFVKTIVSGSFGESATGYDGTTAWVNQPGAGYMILSGEMAEQAKSQAEFLADFPEPGRYSSIETVALEDFEGKKCYKVKLVKAAGGETIQYFDVESGLAAGSIRSTETQMGKMDITSVLSDYKEQGGVLMPSKVIQKTPQGDVMLLFTTYEWDNVDPAVFNLPDGVKAMIPKPN